MKSVLIISISRNNFFPFFNIFLSFWSFQFFVSVVFFKLKTRFILKNFPNVQLQQFCFFSNLLSFWLINPSIEFLHFTKLIFYQIGLVKFESSCSRRKLTRNILAVVPLKLRFFLVNSHMVTRLKQTKLNESISWLCQTTFKEVGINKIGEESLRIDKQQTWNFLVLIRKFRQT